MLSANVYLFIYFMPESLDSNIMRIDSNNLHLCNVQVYKTHALKKNSFGPHKIDYYLSFLFDR